MDDEQWRDIPGYEGNYRVSSLGEVATRPRPGSSGGRLRPTYDRKGYPYVSLYRDSQRRRTYLHILVAEQFVGPRPPGAVVRHRDGDPANPAASNLLYGTQSDNELDKIAHGRHNNARKTHCPQGHSYAEHAYRAPSRPNARYCGACSRIRANGGRLPTATRHEKCRPTCRADVRGQGWTSLHAYARLPARRP